MMEQFTPGPWGVWSDLDVVSLPSGDTLATVYGSPFTRDDAENKARQKANARLIAAAPELYEALVEAAATFRKYQRMHENKIEPKHETLPLDLKEKIERNRDLANKYEAVCAKARGES